MEAMHVAINTTGEKLERLTESVANMGKETAKIRKDMDRRNITQWKEVTVGISGRNEDMKKRDQEMKQRDQ